MKKTAALLLSLFALLLMLSLAACGGKEEESAPATPSPSPSPSAAPTVAPTKAPPQPTEEPTPVPTEEPTPEPEPDPEPDGGDTGGQVWIEPSGNDPDPDGGQEPDPPADPSSFIGSDVNALYAVYGYPSGSDYGPSCFGPGEDGVLYYDGFTVYTYRLDGAETINDIS